MVLTLSGVFDSGVYSGKQWRIVNVNSGSSYRLYVVDVGLDASAITWKELLEVVSYFESEV